MEIYRYKHPCYLTCNPDESLLQITFAITKMHIYPCKHAETKPNLYEVINRIKFETHWIFYLFIWWCTQHIFINDINSY